MSLDIVALGRAMTIRFLHEQIWFTLGHKLIGADIACDAFIRNDSPATVEQLRLNVPHYVHPDKVKVLSAHERLELDNDGNAQRDKYSWIGKFQYNDLASEMNLSLDFRDPTLGRAGAKHMGMLLTGSFPPDGLIPSGTRRTEGYLEAMRKLDRVALDLDLNEKLGPGKTGWLRIVMHLAEWPYLHDLVSLPAFSFLRESCDFLCDFRILSPQNLREDLRESLREQAYLDWYDVLVDFGWNAPDTLTRIEDHRISLVFPPTASITHVTTAPDGGIQALVGSVPSCRVQGQNLLHFVMGSSLNASRDVVNMANRVCDFCAYVIEGGNPPPTREQLLDRFGGSKHEAIGVLIDEMIRAHLLVFQGDDRTKHYPTNQRPQALLNLRRSYTFPTSTKHGELLGELRDLHPFRIRATLQWRAFTSQQTKRMKLIDELLGWFEEHSYGTQAERKALVVWCSKYDKPEHVSYEQLAEVGAELCNALEDRAQFKVTRLPNPKDGDTIVDYIKKALGSLKAEDLFLLWFIGHGEPNADKQYLHLVPTGEGKMTLPWSRVAEEMSYHKRVTKLVVLDCCHAGLAKGTVPPENTCIWPTTDATHSAEAGGIVGNLDSGKKSENFTEHAVRILTEHTEAQPLGFVEMCSEAQEDSVCNKQVGPLRDVVRDPLIVDPGYRKEGATSFDELVATITARIADYDRRLDHPASHP